MEVGGDEEVRREGAVVVGVMAWAGVVDAGGRLTSPAGSSAVLLSVNHQLRAMRVGFLAIVFVLPDAATAVSQQRRAC